MKTQWNEQRLAQEIERLENLTGKAAEFTVALSDTPKPPQRENGRRTLYFDENLVNHPKADDSRVLMMLIYMFCMETKLIYSLGRNMDYDTVMKICEGMGVEFTEPTELEKYFVNIRRLCYSDDRSTLYRKGDRIMRRIAPKKYTITDIGRVVDGRREITAVADDGSEIKIEEKDIIENYALIEIHS